MLSNATLENDNRDLALELSAQQELNAKLLQSINELWHKSEHAMIKMDQARVAKTATHAKMKRIISNIQTNKCNLKKTKSLFMQFKAGNLSKIKYVFFFFSNIFLIGDILIELMGDMHYLRNTVTTQQNLLKDRVKTFTKELDKQSKIHNEQLEYFEKKQLENRSTIQKLQHEKELLLSKIDTLMYVPIPNANIP